MRKILFTFIIFFISAHLIHAQEFVEETITVELTDVADDGYIYKRLNIPQGKKVELKNAQLLGQVIEPKGAFQFLIPESKEVILIQGVERKKDIAFLRIPGHHYNEQGKLEQTIQYNYKLAVRDNDKKFVQNKSTDIPNSILATGNWYKISVPKRGMYKIDYNFIQSLGVTPSSVNPNNIRIYGNGGSVMSERVNDDELSDPVENAIIVQSSGSTFGTNDYVLFYANGPRKWEYMPAKESFDHTLNYFEDYSYYFINFDLGPGRRIGSREAKSASDTLITSYSNYSVIQADTISPAEMGRTLVAYPMISADPSSLSKSFTVNFGQTIGQISLSTSVFSKTDGSNNIFKININGNPVQELRLGAISDNSLAVNDKETVRFSPASSTLNVSLKFTPSGSGTGYLEYLRFNGEVQLDFNSASQLSFRSKYARNVEEGKMVGYEINGVNNQIVFLDITNPLKPVKLNGLLTGSKYYLSTSSGTMNEFFAYHNSTGLLTPAFVEKVDNQNLHSLPSFDFLIITHNVFKEQAEDLASFHRSLDGKSVYVVTVDKIYNEFSSGGQDIAGIRNFIKHIYDKGTSSERLKNVLFLGAASYDYKNRISNNTNFVPVFQTENSYSSTSAYSTDDFYALLDPGEYISVSNYLDIGVGRIPARNVEQAKGVVEKIKSYLHSTSFGPWKNNFTFASDNMDISATSKYSHSRDMEDIANVLNNTNPDFNQIKFYGDAYKAVVTPSGAKLIALNKGLNDQIFLGSFLFNYVGHGAPNRLSQEDVLTIEDIRKWKNKDKLPLVITATCDFGRFDHPTLNSGGMEMLIMKEGGAIGSVTTTQLVYVSQNKTFNSKYVQTQFTRDAHGRYPTMGEGLYLSKNEVGGATDNNVKYVLLGDPALPLAIPQYKVVTDSLIDFESQLSVGDSIKALGKYTLKGSVRNVDDIVIEEFNGKIYLTIYDKVKNIPYLVTIPGAETFTLQNSIIYKGEASVENGEFSITFVTPKDINYDFGKGKISYYAENGSFDAAGADTNFIVGGFATNAEVDYEPPVVEAYIDNDKFRNGSIVSEEPLLFVKLYDDNGINVTGASVGHDLVAILDDDISNPFVLNNYYQSLPNSYQEGTVSFRMPKLPKGKHKITVKAWDVYNNSGQGSVDFEVVSKDEIVLGELYNYPNPFTNGTTFVIPHNRSGEILKITVDIYDVKGSRVKKLEVAEISSEGSSIEIPWDGSSDNGPLMGGGVYLYKVTIKNEKEMSTTGSAKMVYLP